MGRPKKQDDEKILRAVALSPDPVVTASEIADVTDYNIDGARGRLEDLYEEGWVDKRKVGARATVWWLTDAGRKQLR